MAKLIDITGRPLSGEWGKDDENGDGIPVLRTTNFTNEGVVNYDNVVTRTITKKNIDDKFLRKGDIIIEKSGGSDKFPVGRVIHFNGDENTYLFNNFTGLLRVKDKELWYPKYVFYSLYANYKRGGTRIYENKTTGLHNLKTDDYVSRYEIKEIDMVSKISICEKLDMMCKIVKFRKRELQLLDELVRGRFVEMFYEKGYPVLKWNDVFTTTTGKLDSNASDEKGTYPFFTCSKEVLRIDTYAFDQEALLLAGNNAAGKYDVKYYNGKFNAYQRTYVLSLKENWSYRLFQYQLENKLEYLKQQSLGGLTKYLTLKILGELEFVIPPKELQSEFETFVKQVDKSKLIVQKELDETQLLFDSLMQEYFG